MTMILEKMVTPQLATAIRREVGKVVTATAFAVMADAVIAIQTGSKTGRVYKRGNIRHRASAAGEAPATEVGTLASSAAVENVDALTKEVTFGAKHAEDLERGTPGGKIAPRPFLRPAVDKAEEGFEDAVVAAINKAIASVAGN